MPKIAPLQKKGKENPSKWLSCCSFLTLWIAFVKFEAHTKKTEPEDQGNTPAVFHPKAATTESVKVLVHVDTAHSAAAKTDPLCPDFCHPDVLVTWQQFIPKPENLKWVKNSCKTIRAMKNPRRPPGFSWLLTNLTFIWWVKTFLGYRVDVLTVKKK